MRVVGGMWRGRELKAPGGHDTRPTTDRTREACASMVASSFGLDLSGVSVLDAFAGSGALGIELLSRGAARATFVDSSRQAASCVRANLAALGAQGCSVVGGDVFKLPERLPGGPFSVVLLDPPYAVPASHVAELLGRLAASRALAPCARVWYERSSSSAPLELSGTGAEARVVKSKRYGSTSVDLMVVGSSEGGGQRR